MEKFSLYDLLSVLFPGVIFLYILDGVRTAFGIAPDFALTDRWEVIIVLSVLFGAAVYVVSFRLVSQCKWVYRFCGIYTHVTVLYNELGLQGIIGKTLNKRANEWYEQDLYFSKDDFSRLSVEEQKEKTNLQDEFYDRMYYELDYEEKLETAKSFQSFYLFFRNVFVASVLGILFLWFFQLVYSIPLFGLEPAGCKPLFSLSGIFVLVALVSVYIARWYRKRMVMKMYWYFYSHINTKK